MTPLEYLQGVLTYVVAVAAVAAFIACPLALLWLWERVWKR